MLAEIYGWFTEGFDTKDLQEAKGCWRIKIRNNPGSLRRYGRIYVMKNSESSPSGSATCTRES